MNLLEENDQESEDDSDKEQEEEKKEDKILLNYFDTIVMNPPFGTNNAGIDMKLLLIAAKALKAGGQLFSIHKLKTIKPEMTKNFI